MRRDLELFESTLVIVVHPINALAEREVRFRKIRLQSQSCFGLCSGLCFPGISGLVKMENLRANRRQSRVSEREIWVERNRLHEKLLGSLIILQERVGISRDLVRPQVKHVGIRVLCRLDRHSRFFIRAQVCAESVCDFARQLPLQSKRVNKSSVVPICPDVAVIARVDELDVHHHPIAFPPDTAFKYICNPQCLCDLAQVSRGAVTELYDRRTANKPKLFDLAQTRKDVILNAVREKRVCLLIAKICKRQNRYAFFRNCFPTLGAERQTLVNEHCDH